MENLALENYGIVEMDSNDTNNITGGAFDPISFVLGAVASYVIGEVVDGCLRYASGERIK